MAEVISVSALNQYVKTLLDANDILFDLAREVRSLILCRIPGADTAIFPSGMRPAV